MGYIDVSNETNRRVGTSDEEEHGHDRPGCPLSGGGSCPGPPSHACDLWALGYRPRRHCGCVSPDEFRRVLPALHPAEAVDGGQALTTRALADQSGRQSRCGPTIRSLVQHSHYRDEHQRRAVGAPNDKWPAW